MKTKRSKISVKVTRSLYDYVTKLRYGQKDEKFDERTIRAIRKSSINDIIKIDHFYAVMIQERFPDTKIDGSNPTSYFEFEVPKIKDGGTHTLMWGLPTRNGFAIFYVEKTDYGYFATFKDMNGNTETLPCNGREKSDLDKVCKDYEKLIYDKEIKQLAEEYKSKRKEKS